MQSRGFFGLGCVVPVSVFILTCVCGFRAVLHKDKHLKVRYKTENVAVEVGQKCTRSGVHAK